MDDKTRALLGDHEAAKRLTDAGVLLPCPFCKGEVRRVIGFGGLNFFRCRKCGAVVRRVGRWRLRFSVFCSRCDKSTIPGSAWKLTKLGAIREWDSRWLPCGKEKTDGMDT